MSAVFEPPRLLAPLDPRRYQTREGDLQQARFCEALWGRMQRWHCDVPDLERLIDTSLLPSANAVGVTADLMPASAAVTLMRVRQPSYFNKLLQQLYAWAVANDFFYEHLWRRLTDDYIAVIGTKLAFVTECMDANKDYRVSTNWLALRHLTALTVHKRLFHLTANRIRDDTRGTQLHALLSDDEESSSASETETMAEGAPGGTGGSATGTAPPHWRRGRT